MIISLRGTIKAWMPERQYAIIEAQDREYYAHAVEFVAECGCGQKHKCEIAKGQQVEFDVFVGPHTGRWPSARKIRVTHHG